MVRLAGVVLAVLMLAGCTSSDLSGDVKVTSCSRTAFTGPVATVEITNSSGQERDYFVTVKFTAQDGSSGDGYSGDVAVPAGATQQAEVHAVGNRGPMPVSCDVTDVSGS